MKQFSLKHTEVILGILLVLSSAFLLSCSSVSSDTFGQVTQNKKPMKSGLDAKAKEEAEKILNKYFTQYGDSYFLYEYHTLVHYKSDEWSTPPYSEESWSQFADVSVDMRSYELPDSNYRNGFDWKGVVAYKCKSKRNYSKRIGTENKEELSAWNNGGVFLSIELSHHKTRGWETFYIYPYEIRRIVSSRYFITEVSSKFNYAISGNYDGSNDVACSDEEKNRILDLDAKKLLCRSGDPIPCGGIMCSESRFKKIARSELPRILLK